jgi:hypothetical protein
VLQGQHSQRDFGWRSFASSRGALGPPSSQRFVDRLDQLFVIQNLVSDLHPRFPAIIDAVADESFAELALVVLSFDHYKLLTSNRRRAFYDLNPSGWVQPCGNSAFWHE